MEKRTWDMRRRVVLAAVAGAAIAGSLVVARAQTGETSDCPSMERKGKAIMRICMRKCQEAVRAGTLTGSDCEPPYDTTIAECVALGEAWLATAKDAGCAVSSER